MKPLSNDIVYSIILTDDGIVEVLFKDNALIDLDQIKHTYALLDELTGQNIHKKLIVPGRHTTITKEARLYGMDESKRLSNIVAAEAIVVNSLYQKMVINFYNQFIKKNIPVKLFTDVNKAKEWLLSI